VYLDGVQRMVHLPSLLWDVAVIGRQVASPGGQAATGVPVSCLRPDLLRAAGGYRAAEFTAFADAIDAPNSAPPRPANMAVFYTSDFVVFSRPAYRASLRMIGARVAGGECINGEGTHSLHMGDGAFYVYKTGHEYEDIGATWDWQKLPGTTVQVNGTQLNCSTADSQGVLPNVGGVTDGLIGLAYMDFEQPAYGQVIAARKTAVFTDAAILLLGSNVTSAPLSRVTTTVESRLLAGDGVVAAGLAGRGPLSPLTTGTHALPPPLPGAPLLVYHGGAGYIFPEDPTGTGRAGASVNVMLGPVSGSWEALNGDPAAPNVTNGMFTLWIDHGDAPVSDASYGALTISRRQAVIYFSFVCRLEDNPLFRFIFCSVLRSSRYYSRRFRSNLVGRSHS
jgi:chondroitin AC lyase